jgi:preprotein translocase subunit SecF
MNDQLLTLKNRINYKLVGWYKAWFLFSVVFILACLVFVLSNGLRYGIDFTGGTQLLYRVAPVPEVSMVREVVNSTQIPEIESAQIQLVDGKDVSVRTKPLIEADRQKINEALKQKFSEVEVLQVDTIGPSIGAELSRQAVWIVLITMAGLLIYIAFRFDALLGFAAILALLHDAMVTMAFVSFARVEMDTAIIAALLTILGYSINDTIVLFDRFREIKNQNPDADIVEIGNASVSQTLARSINTVLTVLLVLAAMYLWGGSTLKSFVSVLFVGCFSGMYSSIIIALPAYIFFKKMKWGKKK